MSSDMFLDKLAEHHLKMGPRSVTTLQMNITKLCNQACRHCHVDAGPKRRETMSQELMAEALRVLERYPQIEVLDVTGGAPELHPGFKDLVFGARKLGRRVMVRHNLTVTEDPHPTTGESMAYLPGFFKEAGVEIVSSLPFYSAYFTDRQRGRGVFEKSIDSLKKLNACGFGREDTGLKLNLVYNPVGTYLPPAQSELEKQYKAQLLKDHGIVFNELYVITNMPIHRFAKDLKSSGKYEEYMEKLSKAFNPHAAENVMCRDMVSVSWDGYLYDCDFNQMLDLKIEKNSKPLRLENFEIESFLSRDIILKSHCLGCTAGAGSSCGGATA